MLPGLGKKADVWELEALEERKRNGGGKALVNGVGKEYCMEESSGIGKKKYK